MTVDTTDAVALVVHELRSPLGYLATAARLMAEESEQPAVRQRCDVIERTASRMLRATQSILEAAGVLQADEEERSYSPRDVVRQVVCDARGLGVPVRLELCEEEAEQLSFGRPTHLETLLQSLLTNALDHGDPNGGILITAASEAGALRVEIANAIGAGAPHRGLGLGASLCERLRERCGASLETASEEGWYRVTVRLPLIAPAPAGRSPHHERLQARRHQPQAAGASA